jgi:hypothetical protein
MSFGRATDLRRDPKSLRGQRKLAVLSTALALSLAPHLAAGQTLGDPAASAQIQAGPVGLTPRFALRNIGVDTNVFNSVDDPQRDFTFYAVPGLDAFLRAGRVRLTSRTQLGFSYFHVADSQRSADLTEEARADVDLIHFAPFVTAGYARTRQRFSPEIDERVAQFRTSVSYGVRVLMLSKLELAVESRHEQLDVGETEFGNPQLAQALNRASSDISVTGRLELTSLTSLVVRTGVRRDGFEFTDLRDSSTFFVLPGIEFEPLALLSGRASLGLQHFSTERPDLPDVTGMMASIDLGYVFRDTTRLGGRLSRDVGYSFEPTQPFFIGTAAMFEATQSVAPSWTITGRIGRTTLTYRSVGELPDADAPRRQDVVLTYGAAVSRRLSRQLQVGVDADWNRRRSPLSTRGYRGFRMGGFLTYGG